MRYQDDCFTLDLTYQRSFIQDQDIKPDERFLVDFVLKYLGQLPIRDPGRHQLSGRQVRNCLDA